MKEYIPVAIALLGRQANRRNAGRDQPRLFQAQALRPGGEKEVEDLK